jgi:hypothetical protein
MMHSHIGTYLDDGGAGSDGVVGDILVTAGEDDVGLASEAGGHGDAEAAVDSSGVDKGGTGDGYEGGVDGGALSSLEDVALVGGERYTR